MCGTLTGFPFSVVFQPPYVGMVECLWQDRAGAMMMRTRWFYRVNDLPSHASIPAKKVCSDTPASSSADHGQASCVLLQCDPHEVFLSPDWNDNPVNIFLRKANLSLLEDMPAGKQTTDWCARQIDPPSGKVSPLSSSFFSYRLNMLKKRYSSSNALIGIVSEGDTGGTPPAPHVSCHFCGHDDHSDWLLFVHLALETGSSLASQPNSTAKGVLCCRQNCSYS